MSKDYNFQEFHENNDEYFKPYGTVKKNRPGFVKILAALPAVAVAVAVVVSLYIRCTPISIGETMADIEITSVNKQDGDTVEYILFEDNIKVTRSNVWAYLANKEPERKENLIDDKTTIELEGLEAKTGYNLIFISTNSEGEKSFAGSYNFITGPVPRPEFIFGDNAQSQDNRTPVPNRTIKPIIKETPIPTTEPTAIPSIISSMTPEPIHTPIPVVPTRRPSPTPIPPIHTRAPLPIVTPKPTIVPTASPVPTVAPTITPTVEPTVTPTAVPTMTPTIEPTVTPTVTPTITPTVEPTVTPTVAPTITPTVEPTVTPTTTPTDSQVYAGTPWVDAQNSLVADGADVSVTFPYELRGNTKLINVDITATMEGVQGYSQKRPETFRQSFKEADIQSDSSGNYYAEYALPKELLLTEKAVVNATLTYDEDGIIKTMENKPVEIIPVGIHSTMSKAYAEYSENGTNLKYSIIIENIVNPQTTSSELVIDSIEFKFMPVNRTDPASEITKVISDVGTVTGTSFTTNGMLDLTGLEGEYKVRVLINSSWMYEYGLMTNSVYEITNIPSVNIKNVFTVAAPVSEITANAPKLRHYVEVAGVGTADANGVVSYAPIIENISPGTKVYVKANVKGLDSVNNQTFAIGDLKFSNLAAVNSPVTFTYEGKTQLPYEVSAQTQTNAEYIYSFIMPSMDLLDGDMRITDFETYFQANIDTQNIYDVQGGVNKLYSVKNVTVTPADKVVNGKNYYLANGGTAKEIVVSGILTILDPPPLKPGEFMEVTMDISPKVNAAQRLLDNFITVQVTADKTEYPFEMRLKTNGLMGELIIVEFLRTI